MPVRSGAIAMLGPSFLLRHAALISRRGRVGHLAPASIPRPQDAVVRFVRLPNEPQDVRALHQCSYVPVNALPTTVNLGAWGSVDAQPCVLDVHGRPQPVHGRGDDTPYPGAQTGPSAGQRCGTRDRSRPAVIKLVFCLTRKDGTSREEF